MNDSVYVPPGKGVVLFDGVCNVCNGFVQFVIDRDTTKHFVFASLQSDIGQKLCTKFGIPIDLNTMVLIEGEEFYTKSSAFLRVLSQLSGAWPVLFYSCYCIPSFLRDIGYTIFAQNRYLLFGKNESCRLMTPDLKQRFLEFCSQPPRPALVDVESLPPVTPVPASSSDKDD